MLAIETRINDELKKSMLARDQLRTDVLRAMKSAIKYKFVEKKQAELTEEEVLSIFQTQIKQRREAIEQYEKAGRQDLADKEKKEIEVVSEFLPKALSEGEIKNLIQSAIKTTGATGPQDMGKVMKEIKPQTVGRADSKVVADLVKQLLSAA